jgi:acyl-CoA synthetase (AMP-forming)/AMP-acid ligase II
MQNDFQLTVGAMRRRLRTCYPRQEVVTLQADGTVRATYAQVADRVDRLGRVLERLGVAPGERVATFAWNAQPHFELYLAVPSYGAVLHTINIRLFPDQIEYIVNHAQDGVMFVDGSLVEPLARLAPKFRGVRQYVVMGDGDLDALPGALSYEQLLEEAGDGEYGWPELDERAAAALCYTSGTTGNPKGVLYSHRSVSLHSTTVCAADAVGLSSADRVLVVVPMFHVNAWGVPYAAAMVGAKVVLPGPKLDGASLVELIEGEQVTCLLGVPTVWMGLLAYLREQGKTLTTVKKVACGGSAAPPSMIQAFERDHGVQMLHAWGMTEMSPLGTVSVPLPKHSLLDAQSLLALKCKQGRPIFGVDIRIVGADGVVLPHDGTTSGHLQVRGNWIVDTYFKSPDGPAHKDGWFDTGDIATIDEDSFVQITDRAKDVIKSGGEWISSIALENAAMSHPSVAQAAAIGVPDPKWVERPLLFVVKAAGRDVCAEELNEFLETKVVKWWLPDAIEFVDALPIGATGKVLKRELREKFAARGQATKNE